MFFVCIVASSSKCILVLRAAIVITVAATSSIRATPPVPQSPSPYGACVRLTAGGGVLHRDMTPDSRIAATKVPSESVWGPHFFPPPAARKTLCRA